MRYVYYHKSCADGLSAAVVFYQKFKDTARYVGIAYGDELPDADTYDKIYFVDFAPSREWLEEAINNYVDVQVIDHHETAVNNLAGMPRTFLDIDYSGAVLAWKYLYGNRDVPEFLLYVQDRDLWRWQLPNSREINLALSSYPKTLETWLDLYTRPVASFIPEGVPLVRERDSYIESALRQVRFGEVAGIYVPVVNATHHISELCEAMYEKYPDFPFVASYYDGANIRRWSLRSKPGVGENVAFIASVYGGGGHRHAAGFQSKIPDLGI